MNSSCKANSAQQQLELPCATRYWPRDRPPRRDQLLDLLDRAIDWQALEKLVRPHYNADSQPRGRRGFGLRTMLRSHLISWLWRASDRTLEGALSDSKAFARFCGPDPWAPKPPSAAAIRGFRKLLDVARPADAGWELSWLIDEAFRSGIHRAGLDFRHGTLTEPVFRRMPTAPGQGGEGSAVGTGSPEAA